VAAERMKKVQLVKRTTQSVGTRVPTQSVEPGSTPDADSDRREDREALVPPLFSVLLAGSVRPAVVRPGRQRKLDQEVAGTLRVPQPSCQDYTTAKRTARRACLLLSIRP